MGKFREILEAKPKLFKHENPNKWSPDEDAYREGNKSGLTMIGIGELAKFVKQKKLNAFVFWYPFKNEKDKEAEFKSQNKNKDEMLVRYSTRVTAAGGMAPLCILNVAKGYMRFMENINDDPDLKDAKWSKPQFFDHLRTTL